jgi:putative phage-type endonuclease
MKQQTKEWKNLRKKYIGASDAPVIMGVSTFVRQDGFPKTPYILWKEKLDLLPEEEATYSMQFGIDEEEKAREIYFDKTGIKVTPQVVFNPKIKYMMSSLDGLSEDKKHCVEIKHANEKDHETAAQGKVPEKYFPQLQHQLDCLGIDQMHYLSRHKDDVVIFEVGVDKTYLNSLHEKEKEFWDCLVSFKEPALSERDYMERDEKWYEQAKKLKEIKALKKEIESKEKEQEKILREISGEKPSFFKDLKYFYYMRKGAVDYSKIPELAGVDLEPYRKKYSTVWRIS